MRGTRIAAWAIVVAATTFLFRILTAAGFANDHYMHLAWAQALLAGDLPGRDFVDPGMLFTYSLSAAVQHFSATPFSELLLTAGMIAVATGLTVVVTARLTRSVAAGVAAAAAAMVLRPHFYSYPKILVPVVTLAVLGYYLKAPSSRWRLVLLGIWTVAAGLLRYDLGLYTLAAVGVSLLVANYGQGSRLRLAVSTYAITVAVAAVPYLAFLQWTSGIAHHFDEAMEFARSDAHQLTLALPPSPALSGDVPLAAWSAADSVAMLLHLARAVVPLAALTLLLRRAHYSQERAAGVIAAIVLQALYVGFILRHPFAARLLDMASIGSIVAIWTATELLRVGMNHDRPAGLARRLRRAWLVPPVVATTAMAGCFVWNMASVRENLAETSVTRGWQAVRDQLEAVRYQGTVWPWRSWWPAGDYPPAVSYVTRCTAPTDRLFVTWPAAEYYYFSRRPFAGGLALVLAPQAFARDQDQQQLLDRLGRRRVPIVLINETRRPEIRAAIARVDAYLDSQYEPVGRFTIYDGSVIAVAVRRDLQSTGRDEETGWPCYATPDTATGSAP